jgi:hypothetical protein
MKAPKSRLRKNNFKPSPYPENDIKTFLWDIALSMNQDPEKLIQEYINPRKFTGKFNPKQHWRDVFGTEPPEYFGHIPIEKYNI